MDAAGLAEFLRERRAALRPPDVGLPTVGRRRTPGLRREEVAALAGMSADYYERLEQARGPHPSAQVLAALGRALRLGEAERAHLARLAGEAPPAAAIAETVPPTVRALLERLGPIPALVRNDRHDVLAWNGPASAVLGDFAALAPAERNVLRISLRAGPRCTAPAGEEERFTDQAASALRDSVARHPADRALSRLVADLLAASPAFATRWARHDVRPVTTLRKRIIHPELGPLELDAQTLAVPGERLHLVMFTAEPGSVTERALHRLAAAAATTAPAAPTDPTAPAPAGLDRAR